MKFNYQRYCFGKKLEPTLNGSATCGILNRVFMGIIVTAHNAQVTFHQYFKSFFISVRETQNLINPDRQMLPMDRIIAISHY